METPVKTLYTSGQSLEPYKSADGGARFALSCCDNCLWKGKAYFVIGSKQRTNAEKVKVHAQTEAMVLVELLMGALPHHKMDLELEAKEREKHWNFIKELICEESCGSKVKWWPGYSN